ncbi:hypothetical protein [Mycobacterium sp. 1274761.0]|uniref:hypothetical protein n=1 Tax=Mycobacterium sp. 1274761.0 TaxID=1834077 RepID=UPI0007FE7778|nr:hypothetical protein [Mycobacterium sp. 1274761.0]OBK73857.1 hypothetical protein A5651_13170 [Mycobacterium sp. 1274761.0]
MSWARDEVLFRAQSGLLGLRAVQNLVFRELRGATGRAQEEVVQQALVDLVRSLVDDRLAVVGDRTQAGFVPWTIPVVDGLDGREGWLQLTEAGRAAARDVPVGDEEVPDTAATQWDWPFAQAAARVLVYGTIDWVELGQIHWRVKEVSPDVPIQVVQQRTLDLIAELIRGGLVVVGSIDAEACGFVAWDCPVEDALDRIRAVYVDRFDDESAWEWFCLLELTRRGTVLAKAIEAQTPP